MKQLRAVDRYHQNFKSFGIDLPAVDFTPFALGFISGLGLSRERRFFRMPRDLIAIAPDRRERKLLVPLLPVCLSCSVP